MSKIIIYGGSFNPITNAHVELARQARLYYRDAHLYWCVSESHAFNKQYDVSYEARVELIKRSVQSANILPMGKYMMQFVDSLPYDKKDLTILIGSDILNNINKWDSFIELIKGYHFTIGSRKGVKLSKTAKEIIKVMNYTYICNIGSTSSTDVRKFVKTGQSINDLVPRKIRLDIKELYK